MENSSANTTYTKEAASIVAAYVGANRVQASELPSLIASVHSTLVDLASGETGSSKHGAQQPPSVPIEDSVTKDYLVCLEDGKRLKMLKRHLRTQYNLSPEEYRARWGLSADYPMVAPNYAAQRSVLAKNIGLGKVSGHIRKKAKKH